MFYDLIIIGAGPAGITAAVYAARKRMNILVVTVDIGGQAAWSGEVENYTGYQFISGLELAHKFEEHMKTFDIPLAEGEPVRAIEKTTEGFTVKTDGQAYISRSVIIASGKRSRKLGVPGEEEFRNKGVTYCATCDGPLFSNQEVAVIGGGNSALDAGLQLMNIASKVYIVNLNDRLGGDEVMCEKLEAHPGVVILNNSSVEKIEGEAFVNAVTVRTGERSEKIPVKGVFVEIGLDPNSEFADIVDKNSSGEIMVDNRNQTSAKGIFACGDVTDVPEKQIIVAAGEGAKASLGVFKYLAGIK